MLWEQILFIYGLADEILNSDFSGILRYRMRVCDSWLISDWSDQLAQSIR